MVLILSALTGTAFGTGVIVGLAIGGSTVACVYACRKARRVGAEEPTSPGQSRERSSPGGLAGQRPSLPYSQRNEGSPNTGGIAIITMAHLPVALPHDLGARVLEIRKCRRWWL